MPRLDTPRPDTPRPDTPHPDMPYPLGPFADPGDGLGRVETGVTPVDTSVQIDPPTLRYPIIRRYFDP
jgi:hypothetical protein